jgi:hypothetical protein
MKPILKAALRKMSRVKPILHPAVLAIPVAVQNLNVVGFIVPTAPALRIYKMLEHQLSRMSFYRQ